MPKIVNDQYIEQKYGNGHFNDRYPNNNQQLVTDEQFINIIELREVSATDICDELNRTSHKYKRVNYNHIHRRLTQMYNQNKIIKIEALGHITLWKNNTKYKPKPKGFKAWMQTHAPKCNKLIMR